MIRIYKGNDIKVVTKGAYTNFYKPLGYNIIVESEPIEKLQKESERKVDLEINSNITKKTKSTKKNKKED